MRRRAAFSLILIVLAVSCSKKEEAPSPGKVSRVVPETQSAAPAADLGRASTPAAADRKLVLSHELTVETSELETVFREVSRLAEQAGGYFTQSSRHRLHDGSYRARLVFRLPPKAVGGFLDRVRALGKVLSENSTGQDVTEEYTDLEARLQNAKVSEQRLRGFLADRTEKLSDVLAVEREITRMRGDIEAMEAKKRNLDLLTQTVAVVIELVEPPRAAPAVRRVWFPIKTAFGEALVLFAESLRAMIVFLGAATPWAVLTAAVIYVYVRVRRRRRTRLQ